MIFLLFQKINSEKGEFSIGTIVYSLFIIIILAVYVSLMLSYKNKYDDDKLIAQDIIIRAELCVQNNLLSSDLSKTCYLSNNRDYVLIDLDGTEYQMNKHLVNANTQLRTELISLTKDGQLKLVKVEYFIGNHNEK
mgnify:CR=1 FL=1